MKLPLSFRQIPRNFPAHLQTLIQRIRTRWYPGGKIYLVWDSKPALRKRRTCYRVHLHRLCKIVKRIAVSLYSQIIFCSLNIWSSRETAAGNWNTQSIISRWKFFFSHFVRLDYAYIDQRETSRKIYYEFPTNNCCFMRRFSRTMLYSLCAP